MVWYSHLLQNFPQFIVIHTVKGFGIVNKAEIDVFLDPPVTREPGRAPPRHAHGDLTCLALHERLPEVLIVPREKTPMGAEKASEFQKNIYFCFIDYAKAFDCVDHDKLWKIGKEMGIPDHLTCLLRNLYAGQEATVRTLHGTIDWFKTGKGVRQGCIPSPCLYAEYIM